jgi:hypothetical protein
MNTRTIIGKYYNQGISVLYITPNTLNFGADRKEIIKVALLSL